MGTINTQEWEKFSAAKPHWSAFALSLIFALECANSQHHLVGGRHFVKDSLTPFFHLTEISSPLARSRLMLASVSHYCSHQTS